MGLLSLWLESLYEPNKITDRCLRKISRISTCTVCVDSCPVDAIRLSNDSSNNPIIDTKTCNECQLCVAVCPPLAIEGMLPKRHYQEKTLILLKDDIPITQRELMFFHKKGLRFVYVEEGTAMESPSPIPKTVMGVNSQLKKLHLKPFEWKKEPPGEVREEQETSVTRRELFGNIVQSGKKNILQNYTPAAWRNNQDQIKLAENYPDDAFYQIQVNQERCTLCGACASLCPEAAIQMNTDEETLSLFHHKCNNCQLCKDVCPDQAIKTTSQETNIKEESFYFFKHSM
ncbi:MAG: 4Fe-4S binding protein [Bacillus sp. (in: Bacteria)]|nr:4Fe-4S binding protein [Bacillus sp. (in: firmicutes)]